MKVFKVEGCDDPPRKPFFVNLFDALLYVMGASLIVTGVFEAINELWGWLCGIQF